MTGLFIALVVLAQEPAPLQVPPPPPPAVPTPSTPPLVGLPIGDEALPPPAPRLETGFEPKPRPPPTAALHFMPLSLFGLYLSVEYERGLTENFAFFAAAGGGPFGQLGFDGGGRLYVASAVLDGFFVDAHLSAFAVTSAPMVLVGPGASLGYTWRLSSRAILSIGAGVTLWAAPLRQTNGTSVFLGSRADSASVIFLPGMQQPPLGQPALQPTLRFTVGPGL